MLSPLQDLTSASVATFMQRVQLRDITVGEEAAREILTQNDWDVEKSIKSCIETLKD